MKATFFLFVALWLLPDAVFAAGRASRFPAYASADG